MSLTCDHVDTIVLTGALVSLNDLEEGILLIEAGVLGKGSWDDKESVSEGLDSELCLSRDVSLHP